MKTVYVRKMTDIAKNGGYRYPEGHTYVGDWNSHGERHGQGKLQLNDGTRYDGEFANDLFNGLGILVFPDGAQYEGEFVDGWFHGYGIFIRSDSMKFEGEFRGGKIHGLGLCTFKDATNGFPRNEGYFQECMFVRRKNCPEIVQRAQKVSLMARLQFGTST